jgi:hypothetical protein
MFLASVVVMAPAYLLLAHPKTFWAFLGVYFLVAVGHGMFKPVVISNGGQGRDQGDRFSMGFGIFYMMVNIGAFLGPIVAGIVRGWTGTSSSTPRRPGFWSWAGPACCCIRSRRAMPRSRASAAWPRSSGAWSRWSATSASSCWSRACW